jgi:hypothetical protein
MNHVRGRFKSCVTWEIRVCSQRARRDPRRKWISTQFTTLSILTTVIDARVPNMAGRKPFL